MTQAKTAPIQEVFEQAGIHREGKGWSPCPVCNKEKRGSRDKRGALFLGRDNDGWVCMSCKAKGDTLNLVAYNLHGKTLADCEPEHRWKVREWFADRHWCDPHQPGSVPPPPRDPNQEETKHGYPPKQEVKQFWDACRPIDPSDTSGIDLHVSQFLSERKWSLEALARSGVARLTPRPETDFDWPEWWPAGRTWLWRLVVPAYTPQGELASVHARAVTKPKDGMPKVLWPKAYEASGLIMADRDGLLFLQRKAKPDIIIVCEGITDLIAASMYKVHIPRKRVAILSCTSGGFPNLAKVFCPTSIQVFAATDEGDKDGTGNRYADQIARAFSPVSVRRVCMSAAVA
jgi:hypothetical protein